MQAPVEIRYEGAVLARAVAPSGSLEDGGTLFLPLADPMPVGTRLELRSERETALVRVVKVTESPEPGAAGVSVRPAGTPEHVEIFEPEPVVAPPPAPAPEPIAAPAAPVVPAAVVPAFPVRDDLPAPAPNGANRQMSIAGTIDNPAVGSGVITATADAGESVEVDEKVDDTTSTSEYPALANGAGTKRRKKSRNKPPR